MCFGFAYRRAITLSQKLWRWYYAERRDVCRRSVGTAIFVLRPTVRPAAARTSQQSSASFARGSTFAAGPRAEVSSRGRRTSHRTSDNQRAGSGLEQILGTEGGQIFSQGLDKGFVLPVPSQPGDMTNQSKGAGISDGKPAAGMGPGTGLVTKPGTIGQTNARPRTPFNPAAFGAK